MINREDYLMIQKSRDKGCYLEDIADDVGCSVSTVKRALRRKGPPPKRKSGVRVSKLEAFKPMVNGLIAENVWNAEVIFAEIREQGYSGGISTSGITSGPSARHVKAGPLSAMKPNPASNSSMTGVN